MRADFRPSIGVGVLRTDNLTLAPVDPEEATVLTVSPQFDMSRDSTRLDAEAIYRMDAYYYDERGEDQIYNQFDGRLAAALIPDRFFLNLTGSRSQSVIDPQSTIPYDNFVVTSNRVDRDEYSVGPSFNVPVGGAAVFDGDLRRTSVRYADELTASTIDDYEREFVTLGFDNYSREAGVTWAVGYDSEETDYGTQFLPYVYRQASFELGFWVTEGARLFATAGKETPWDDLSVTSLEDPFWEVGFSREIGEKLSAELAIGERTFGDSARGSVDYDFGRGTFSVSYDEIPTTTSNDRYDRGGLLDPDDPNDYLSRAGSAERYISKRWESSLGVELARTNVSFLLFDETRENRTDVTGAPLGDESQQGGHLYVTWSVGPRTTISLRGVTADTAYADGEQSDISSLALGIGRELGRRTQLDFDFARYQQEYEFSVFEYTANVFRATVTRRFTGGR